jgi:hypothetical protein
MPGNIHSRPVGENSHRRPQPESQIDRGDESTADHLATALERTEIEALQSGGRVDIENYVCGDSAYGAGDAHYDDREDANSNDGGDQQKPTEHFLNPRSRRVHVSQTATIMVCR